MKQSNDKALKEALNFLCNHWSGNPKLRKSFEAILSRLDAGTKADQKNAAVLRQHLDYPGSESAISAAASIHASLSTQQGRKAAGLTPKRRGREYKLEDVKDTDRLMQVMIQNVLGKASDKDVDREVIGTLGIGAVDATRAKFVAELMPRAKALAGFQKRFLEAWKQKKPL